jgi:hypothetical protein
VLGDNEPKKVSISDTKYTLEGVQADIVLTKSLKNDA